MRQIGAFPNEQQARKFQDHLLTLEVKSMVEECTEAWAVWVYDEDRVEKAKEELAAFVEASDDVRYADVTATANALRQKEIQKAKTAHKNVVDVRKQWQRPMASQCPVTFGLICISIVVAVFSQLGAEKEPVLTGLFIVPIKFDGGQPIGFETLPSAMRQGEVWRLITPIFIHFTFLHIIFNMMWLRELGMVIEHRRGSLRFAAMVLLIAITSNVAEYLHSGPSFGGMSGVVYGLFGYIWMKSKFDPSDGLHMPHNTVVWMIGFFFLCMTNIIGPIANTAHGVGLIMGMVMGYGPSQLRKMRGR